MRILHELSKDCRFSYTELARELGIHYMSVKRRVDKVAAYFVKSWGVQLYRERVGLGYTLLICVKLKSSIPVGTIDYMALHVERHKHILEAYQMYGEFDYVLKVVMNGIEEAQEYVDKLSSEVPDIVRIMPLFSMKCLCNRDISLDHLLHEEVQYDHGKTV